MDRRSRRGRAGHAGRRIRSRRRGLAVQRARTRRRSVRRSAREMGVELFRMTYGTNPNHRNAHGKCVSKHRHAIRGSSRQAVSECKAQLAALNAVTRDDNARKTTARRALRECVKQKLRRDARRAPRGVRERSQGVRDRARRRSGCIPREVRVERERPQRVRQVRREDGAGRTRPPKPSSYICRAERNEITRRPGRHRPGLFLPLAVLTASIAPTLPGGKRKGKLGASAVHYPSCCRQYRRYCLCFYGLAPALAVPLEGDAPGAAIPRDSTGGDAAASAAPARSRRTARRARRSCGRGPPSPRA